MLEAGKAIRVSIYLSEGGLRHSTASHTDVLDFLFRQGVSGASVFKGVAGFGVAHHLHTASIVELSDHLPLKVEFVETSEKVNELMDRLIELAGTGMIAVEELTVVKAAGVTGKIPGAE